MKKLSGLPTLVWVFFVLLVLAMATLRFTDADQVAHPSSLSYEQSGSLAFRDLLSDLGYQVSVNSADAPRVQSDETAIIYRVWAGSATRKRKEHDGDAVGEDEENGDMDSLKGGLYGAKRAIILYIHEDFAEGSRNAQQTPTQVYSSINRQVAYGLSSWQLHFFSETTDDVQQDWSGNALKVLNLWHVMGTNGVFAVATQSKESQAVYVADGLGSTNLFIERLDNAAFYAGLVQSVAPPGSKIVFLETSASRKSPSLLSILAPWAKPAYWQVIVLIILSIYMLGKRFGLPEETRFEQRGAKEMADTLSDITSRGRNSEFVISEIVKDCEREVRKVLKVGRDVQSTDLYKRLPDDIASAFAACLAAQGQKCPESETVRLCKKLQSLTLEFVGIKTTHHVRKKKRF